jgi:phosphoenolpyruvate carboxylase
MAFERLARRGIDAERIAQTLDRAFISPVLTAHPTEVQRKSILDAERAIAELLAARTPSANARELADNEALLRARVTQLWQTRMLRTAKLSVDDEIENALSYYRATFLAQIPILYREVEGRSRATRSRASSAWATGSAATATATRSSTRRRCAPRSRRRARRRCATT